MPDKIVSIHSYAKNGDIDGLKAKLAEGESVDAVDKEKLTPLMHAVQNPKASHDTVRFLIDNGANVNADGGFVDCRTVLGYAVADGDIEKIILLLEAGADVAVVDENGRTALSYATENGDTDIAQQLRIAGALCPGNGIFAR